MLLVISHQPVPYRTVARFYRADALFMSSVTFRVTYGLVTSACGRRGVECVPYEWPRQTSRRRRADNAFATRRTNTRECARALVPLNHHDTQGKDNDFGE